MAAIFLASAAFGDWAFAQAPVELSFTTKYDKFDLLRSGRSYTIGGKPAKLGTFEQFLNLFSSEIEGDCGGAGKPDVTVKARFQERWVERRFYIKKRLVSDGSHCATVSGEGIFFLPLHRSWFDESATMTIALKSPLKITRGGDALATFEKVGTEWRGGIAGEYPNWEFFSTFTESLKDFLISHRVHPSVTDGKPGFVLQTGGKRIEFFKLGATLWVAKVPATPWLVGSAQWTNWIDMEKSQWVDRFSPQLTFLSDKGKDLDSRRGALAALEGQWSPSIRDALKKIMLDEQEANELKMEAVRIMKQKPTLENMGVFIQSLRSEADVDLQYLLSQALRTRNPKGQLIPPDMEESKRQKAITEWREWWRSVQHTKDKY